MDNNANNNTNIQNQPDVNNTNTQPGGTGNNKQRLFTQEDVNRIVSERLKEERTRATATNPLNEREAELSKRESRFACREFLTENGYIPELLEILDTSDKEKFEKTVSELCKIIPQINTKNKDNIPMVVRSTSGGNGSHDERIANAFKSNI